MIKDTIAAVATPPGVGAIAALRISGADTETILKKTFNPKFKKFPLPTHLLCYGNFCDHNGAVVDEVTCVFMKSPRTYTREDMAEIYCHGGTNTVMAILNVLYKSGARPAQPGEFTKRAFLNGRIDLSQAEAVMELINAGTDITRKAILRKLSGGLSHKISGFRDKILKWLAHIELSVDYPEHEEEAMNLTMVYEEGNALVSEIKALRDTSQLGDRIKSGVPTVIVGKPNVGKSSLMNAILQEDRAIVTDIAGTTRDTLTESVTVKNVPILLTDTAGIRKGADQVESIGIERSIDRAQSAELVLFVVDGSQPFTKEDEEIAKIIKDQNVIVVINKTDLIPAPQTHTNPTHINADGQVSCDSPQTAIKVFGQTFSKKFVPLSSKTGEGLNDLYKLVEEMFFAGDVSAEGDIITQARHKYLLDETINHLQKALADISGCVPEDIISIDLKAAYTLLGEVVGEAVGEDILDRIFEEFCVGK